MYWQVKVAHYWLMMAAASRSIESDDNVPGPTPVRLPKRRKLVGWLVNPAIIDSH